VHYRSLASMNAQVAQVKALYGEGGRHGKRSTSSLSKRQTTAAVPIENVGYDFGYYTTVDVGTPRTSEAVSVIRFASFVILMRAWLHISSVVRHHHSNVRVLNAGGYYDDLPPHHAFNWNPPMQWVFRLLPPSA
jgi:hypothetical protein